MLNREEQKMIGNITHVLLVRCGTKQRLNVCNRPVQASLAGRQYGNKSLSMSRMHELNQSRPRPSKWELLYCYILDTCNVARCGHAEIAVADNVEHCDVLDSG